MLDQTTPIIITFNEAPNIQRCLAGLEWAKHIVVVDSGSTDGTLEMLRADPRVTLVHRAFTNPAEQRNAALEHVRTPWVMSLDADYIVSPALREELASLRPEPEDAALIAPFEYWIHGRPIRGAIYPPRELLFRPEVARYQADGHAMRLSVDRGQVGRLSAAVAHDDRKSLERWFVSQIAYTQEEADKLSHTPPEVLSRPDRIRRRLWLAPWVVPLLVLLRGAWRSGWRGWYYALQRGLAETMLALWLLERRLAR